MHAIDDFHSITPSMLEAASEDDLDQFDMGVVRMQAGGVVSGYNAWESRLSGVSKERVIGRNFFTDVAPCTNNYLVAERFNDDGEPELDLVIDYVFTYRMQPTPVRLRLLKSRPARFTYLLVSS